MRAPRWMRVESIDNRTVRVTWRTITIVRDQGRYLPRIVRSVPILRLTRTRIVVVQGLDGKPWAFERSSGKASALGGPSGAARQVTWSDWRVLWGGKSDHVWVESEED